jgi:hypothetical protein
MKEAEKISIDELKQMAERMFGNLVKAVVDIKLKKLVVDAEMHSDEEEYLLQNGSRQEDLWGINLYPEQAGADFIEFDSMINLRPSQQNRTRGVDDPEIQKKIIDIVSEKVEK